MHPTVAAPSPTPATPPASAVRDCDVVVVGGGPAGSTAAALLAERGFSVTLLEKAHHPRFHIGESLLPANLPLLDRLGVGEQVRAIGMEKWGAEFVSPWHACRSMTVQFGDAWDKSMPHAWQVRRSEFDEILLRNAGGKGAAVVEGCRAKSVAWDGMRSTVEAVMDDGSAACFRAPWVVDASGRDTLMARQREIKQKNPKHNSSAIYAHFTGAKRHEGQAEGNITIFWFDHGWFWFIPLADGCTSVGAVVWSYYLKTRDKPLKAFFEDTIALCPQLVERIGGATLASEVEATGNFSYSSSETHGPGHLMIGDAYAFIDPVFSSGVMLAMNGGFVAADTVERCIKEPARARRHLAAFDREIRRGPREFSWFIYRITNPIMRDMLMAPSNVFRVKEALLSMLAGDIFGKTPIWASLRTLKGLYYLLSAASLKRSWMAMKKRRFNVRRIPGVNEGAGDALAGPV